MSNHHHHHHDFSMVIFFFFLNFTIFCFKKNNDKWNIELLNGKYQRNNVEICYSQFFSHCWCPFQLTCCRRFDLIGLILIIFFSSFVLYESQYISAVVVYRLVFLWIKNFIRMSYYLFVVVVRVSQNIFWLEEEEKNKDLYWTQWTNIFFFKHQRFFLQMNGRNGNPVDMNILIDFFFLFDFIFHDSSSSSLFRLFYLP